MLPRLTLRQYLVLENSEVKVLKDFDKKDESKSKEIGDGKQKSKSMKSSMRNDQWPSPVSVVPWKEFNASTVDKIFSADASDLLNRTFDDFNTHPPMSELELGISNEDSLQSLLEATNRKVVCEALRKSTPVLLSQSVHMLKGSHATVQHRPRLRPDWAGKCDARGEENILPGETKTSWVFDSVLLKERLPKNGKIEGEYQFLWPVRQVLNYCIQSHKRYGYIITDKELCILRIGPDEEASPASTQQDLRDASHDYPVVEWKAIPWEAHSKENELTMNLALWALHILAASNGHLDWKYASLKAEVLKKYSRADTPLASQGSSPRTSTQPAHAYRDPDGEQSLTEEDTSEASTEPLDTSFRTRSRRPFGSFVSLASVTSSKSMKRKREKKSIPTKRRKNNN